MVTGSVLIAVSIIIYLIYFIRRKKIENQKIVVGVFFLLIVFLGAAAYNLVTSYQLYDMRGYSMETSNQQNEAVKNYLKAIEKNKDDVFAYNHLVNIYFQNGDYDNALKYCNKLIEIDDNANNYINRGNIFWESQKYSEAYRSYQEAVALNQNAELAYYGLGMVDYANENYEEAFMHFSEYMDRVQYDVDACYYMGTIKFIQNDFDEARGYLDKVVDTEDHSKKYIAYFLKGEISYAKEDYRMAAQNYENSIVLNQEFGDGYYNLSRAYGRLGDKKKSLDNLKRAVDLSDKFKEFAVSDNAFNNILDNQEFLEIIQ